MVHARRYADLRPCEMKTRASVIILFCILVALTPMILCDDGQLCNRNYRTKVYAREILEDGSLLSAEDDAIYPKGTFWADDDETTWACPCLLGNCIRICSEKLTRVIERDLNITLEYGSSNSSITIWDGKNESAVAAIDEEFKLVRDSWCKHAMLLHPMTDEWDAFRILSNGSLYFTYLEIYEENRLVKPDQFCIIPITDGEDLRAVLCTDEIEFTGPIIRKLYPLFFLISAFFLVLTLLTFYHSPDLKNLHGRAMACQSTSFLAVCLCMILIYLTAGVNVDIKICTVISYINYYFTMATFFWLNVLCVDIFLTFKGSIAQKRDINFLYILFYGWGGPAFLTILVIAMDQTMQNNTFSPIIGRIDFQRTHCWFLESWNEFLYYIGPLVILLSLNLTFFCLTAVHLWRMRSESLKVLKDANSKVHAPAGQHQQDKDQFALYAKLFMLMGVTWIMEVISWVIGVHENIWYYTNSVNYLRGVLNFWFCVWSKPNMRKVFLDKFNCRRFRKQSALDMSSKDTSRITTASITSTITA